jgi:hypothetical protein
MGNMSNAHTISVDKLQENRLFETVDADRRIILNGSYRNKV